MRLAVISDIHSNLPALESVLASLKSEGCKRTICLGDIVGYGARPNECIERLQEENIPCILGNHDAAVTGDLSLEAMNTFARTAIEWTNSELTAKSRQFLKSLEYKITEPECLFVHSSPYQPEEWHYVFNQSEARVAFKNFEQPVCFIGHTHFPVLFTDPDSGRRLINVGSVGQPRDRDPRASYGIFDTISGAFSWKRVEYSIAESAKQILEAGLPIFLAERLASGI